MFIEEFDIISHQTNQVIDQLIQVNLLSTLSIIKAMLVPVSKMKFYVSNIKQKL